MELFVVRNNQNNISISLNYWKTRDTKKTGKTRKEYTHGMERKGVCSKLKTVDGNGYITVHIVKSV